MKLGLLFIAPFLIISAAHAEPCVSWDRRDCYEILGVRKFASRDQCKSEFRKLAMRYHPDRNFGNTLAETEFKAVNAAWETIQDADKKAAYDSKLTQKQSYASQNYDFNSSGYQPGYTMDQFAEALRPVVNQLRDLVIKKEIREQAAKWNSPFNFFHNQASDYLANEFQLLYADDPDSLMRLVTNYLQGGPNVEAELVARAAATYWLIRNPQKGRSQFITLRIIVDISKRALDSIKGTVLASLAPDLLGRNQRIRLARVMAQLDYVEIMASNPSQLQRIGAACEVFLKTR